MLAFAVTNRLKQTRDVLETSLSKVNASLGDLDAGEGPTDPWRLGAYRVRGMVTIRGNVV